MPALPIMADYVTLAFVVALGLLMLGTPASSSSLKFLLMVASDSSPDSSAVVPAVDKTLEEINRDTSILPGHHLEYILSDTSQCNSTQALNDFFNVTDSDSSVVAVVGCGCSPATEEVAKISHFKNIPTISYTSTSVVLSDRSVYRSFFRTVPSDELLVSAVATIMNHYRWRQLSVFTEEQPQYLELNQLLQQAENINISVRDTLHWDSLTNFTKFADMISYVFSAQPHIFLPLASQRAETFILCLAYHNGRYYPNYAWILLGHHETDWWREHYMETNCSDTDMMKVLNRSLILIPYPDNSGNTEKYTEQIHEGDLYNVSAYASDSVRALAEALHNCYEQTGSSSSCRGAELDWSITFTGNTGLVRFTANGNRMATRSVLQQYQLRDVSVMYRSVGVVRRSANDTNILAAVGNISESDVWPDGVPPDGTPVAVLHTVSVGITVLHVLLTGIILAAVVVSLVFQIVFRKRKVVKLISPNLNYLLLLGVLFMALSILAYPSTVYAVVALSCTADRFLSSLGYDIVIGIALVKTWRVYYIFKNPSPNKMLIKDWHLMLVVLVIGLVEISFAVPLLAVGLVNGDVALSGSIEIESSKNDQGVLQNFFAINCAQSIFFPIFVAIALAYKLVLHALGVVLACLIRKVKVDVLNDSRETVAIIYASTVLLLIVSFVLLVLTNSVNIVNIAWSVIVFLVALVHLGLTFIPKMIALYKDPRGEKVFDKVKNNSIHLSHISRGSNHSVSSDKGHETEVAALRNTVAQLERKLRTYEKSRSEDNGLASNTQNHASVCQQ